LSLAETRDKAERQILEAYQITEPDEPGIQVTEVPISELRNYIDWTPFFHAWELSGKHPNILNDATVGDQARSLLSDAEDLLDRMEVEGRIRTKATLGIFPANARGDDVEIYTDD